MVMKLFVVLSSCVPVFCIWQWLPISNAVKSIHCFVCHLQLSLVWLLVSDIPLQRMYEIVIVVTVIAAGRGNSISLQSRLAYQIRFKQPYLLNEDSKLAWLQDQLTLSSNFTLDSSLSRALLNVCNPYLLSQLLCNIPLADSLLPREDVVPEYTYSNPIYPPEHTSLFPFQY